MITPEAAAARRYFADRPRPRGQREDLVLVTTPEAVWGLARRGLRRRDRVTWVAGWHDGAAGRRLALAAEQAAAA
ncbi:MAG: hypothetical protein KDB10_20095, partial [Acidimicrobiales bacterium]|nr:hypothetical protein [Acidimicrobiales bacterium]